jgi:hypothetical protein
MGTLRAAEYIRGVFEAKERLEQDLLDLMAAILDLGDGRYACLVERSGILLETAEPEDAPLGALRRLIEVRAPSILGLAAALAGGGDMEDAFSGWEDDEFLVAVLNERVALVVACPDAEALKGEVDPPLRALVDRLLRWKPAYRFDAHGRGLFVGRPRLDLIAVGGHAEEPSA